MIAVFKLLSLLPLVVLRGLGLALGWKVWLASSRYRRVHRGNWQTALSSGRLGIHDFATAGLYRASVGHGGLMVSELPKIWCDKKSVSRMKVTGLSAIDSAIASGRGVIILTPHLGAFELAPRAFAQHHPITVLYRPARQESLRRLMDSLRPMPGLDTAPATGAGVKKLLRALKNGQAIGMLPDQVPSKGDGEWANFFGVPAYTMTLPIRLSQATGAPIFWALAVRTSGGWALDFQAWKPEVDLQTADLKQSLDAMNRSLEEQIARAPEQYLWAYNRYKNP